MVTWKSGDLGEVDELLDDAGHVVRARSAGGHRHVEGDRVVADRAALFAVTLHRLRAGPCRVPRGSRCSCQFSLIQAAVTRMVIPLVMLAAAVRSVTAPAVQSTSSTHQRPRRWAASAKPCVEGRFAGEPTAHSHCQ